eukprot:11179994-Lingulodinium_polyedra.AAC.1
MPPWLEQKISAVPPLATADPCADPRAYPGTDKGPPVHLHALAEVSAGLEYDLLSPWSDIA